MKGMFISYRRVDAAGHAGRLFDRLAAHFGKDAVFMDVEGIEAGVDFIEVIEQAVGGCAVLLAVIGRSWSTCTDERGRRRLDDPQDFIRLEIGSALARKVRVVPVLVEGALMPPVESLPEDLRPLARRQAVELRDSRWDSDVEALIAVLERILAMDRSPFQATPPGRRSTPAQAGQGGSPVRRKHAVWLGGALALIAAVFLAANLLRPVTTVQGPEDAAARIETEPASTSAQTLGTPPIAETSVAAPAVEATRPEPAMSHDKGVAREAIPVAPSGVRTPPKTQADTRRVGPQVAPDPAPVTAAVAPRLPEAPIQAVQATSPPETPGSSSSATQTVMSRPPDPTPSPRIIAVLARGEPSRRDFWEGESTQTYSAKMATLFSDTLNELAAAGVTVRTRSGGESVSALMEGVPAARRQTCDSTGAAVVYVAQVQEGFSISRTESAYWPELRLAVFPCDRDRLHTNRYGLSPRRGDVFPFAKDMGEAMLGFVRDNRHLLP